MHLGTNEAKNTRTPYLISLVPCSNLTAQETGNCCQNGVSSGRGRQGDQRTGSVWETGRPSSSINVLRCSGTFSSLPGLSVLQRKEELNLSI